MLRHFLIALCLIAPPVFAQTASSVQASSLPDPTHSPISQQQVDVLSSDVVGMVYKTGIVTICGSKKGEYHGECDFSLGANGRLVEAALAYGTRDCRVCSSVAVGQRIEGERERGTDEDDTRRKVREAVTLQRDDGARLFLPVHGYGAIVGADACGGEITSE